MLTFSIKGLLDIIKAVSDGKFNKNWVVSAHISKKDTVTQVPNSKNAPEMYARGELASPVSANIITKTNDVVNQKSLDITDIEDTERTLAAANDENHLILKT